MLLAGLINSCRVLGREPAKLRVVISGAGAAGTAIARLLRGVNFTDTEWEPVEDIVVCDSRGAIHKGREGLSPEKEALLAYTNTAGHTGSVHEVLAGADVFIGVSKGGILDGDDIKRMAPDPIILAMANPEPEIMPDVALAAGAAIVGTGRSDFPNQVNNVLAFPRIFRGALDAGAKVIDGAMTVAAAHALADAVSAPLPEQIVPQPLDRSVAPLIAAAVRRAAGDS